MRLRHWLICLLFLLSLPVLAHKASDSYLMLDIKGREVSGQWDIALRDIDFALGLDADGNGEITWGEVRARHADIAAWALGRLALQRGGQCTVRVVDHLVDAHTDGGYAVLRLGGECPAGGGELVLDYRLLFELDALHRGLLRLSLDGTPQTAVFAPQRAEQRFGAGGASRLAQFGQYLVEGIWHIWIGFDHILFLLALLLPAVLVHEAMRWRGVANFRQALVEVLWVVTAFTVAHSITLSLAALGLISLPSRLVESAIAASVVLAAAELGLPQETLVLSLLGFNLGVEAGQLAIVAVFLPLAFRLREGTFYRRVVFYGGSLATLAIALVWFVERAFDLKLIGA